ncbi:MAG: acetylxylan esterase [Verrucomicrobiales bacterium]|nr:acetylxylan esterase [Verrucomicrobiales bacterium]|tara:strand:+ start:2340 stop:4382 length:2043 start_codon:yes stop_codon:yes gene_type:complete
MNWQLIRINRALLAGLMLGGQLLPPISAAPAKTENAFLKFIQGAAKAMRAGDRPPRSKAQWERQRKAIRTELLKAWGGFPKEHAPLQYQHRGELKRDGYRVEKIVFQTLPGAYMTANAYVPEEKGKLPAVLCVHGHWRGAKQDTNVQARCVGLAKLGFFVLAVDAFGAGERGLGKKLGEYHGEMVAATLYPSGKPLSGLQVYENMRAVDYLLTRKEVDGDRIGITGASGGGNQTMYAGAWDERFKAVVPVCSVGNYQAYLGAACCMCEVVPGALKFTEEWGVLSLTVPRALMVISATRDAFQFSVGEAKKSLKMVRPVYGLFGKADNIRHTIIESRHAYNAPMREAMYGWMTLYLKGEGDGSPIKEPEMKLEDPEVLRCYPGETRPGNWMTIPQFAAREGFKALGSKLLPKSADQWNEWTQVNRRKLNESLLGRTMPTGFQNRESESFAPERGIQINAGKAPVRKNRRVPQFIVLTMEGAEASRSHAIAKALEKAGKAVETFSLRATGEHAYYRDTIRRAPDHNTAEWSLWLGRPLLGQWVQDVRAFLNARETLGTTTLIGVGPAALVAVATAAMDDRVEQTIAVDMLASYISDVPYEGQRLGTIVPGVLRDLGDVQHIAAMVAPRKLVIAGGVDGAGKELKIPELWEKFRFATGVYTRVAEKGSLRFLKGEEELAGLWE